MKHDLTKRDYESDFERVMNWARYQMGKKGHQSTPESEKALRAYVSGYNAEPPHGVGILGGVGVGKSFFFSALPLFPKQSMYSERRDEYIPRRTIYASKLASMDYRELIELIEELEDTELIIDDVGAEHTLNNYGCHIEVMCEIFDIRTRASETTSFTTNLTIDELKARYGARFLDRVNQLCKCVSMKGKSKRAISSVRSSRVAYIAQCFDNEREAAEKAKIEYNESLRHDNEFEHMQVAQDQEMTREAQRAESDEQCENGGSLPLPKFAGGGVLL